MECKRVVCIGIALFLLCASYGFAVEKDFNSLGSEVIEGALRGEKRSAAQLHVLLTECDSRVFGSLYQTMQTNDDKYGGTKHIHVSLVAALKMSAAVELLVPHLNYRIDGASVPEFKNYAREELYPVALALAQIQSVGVVRAMVENVVKRDDMETKLLSLWVLYRVLGVRDGVRSIDVGFEGVTDSEQLKRKEDAIRLIATEGKLLDPLFQR